MQVLVLLGGLATLAGCADETTTTEESLTVTLSHEVSGAALDFGGSEYVNAAGNRYTVSRLRYFVSGMALEQSGRTALAGDVHYVDAADPETLAWKVPGVAAGTYERITLFVGVDQERNKTGGLPSTQENIDMAWPEPMGGGYHFLKLEGHYAAPDASIVGFAMHVGSNAFRTPVTIEGPATVVTGSQELRLTMDVNEWFQAPHDYDFDVDGNASMASDSAMQKLMENGADVFHLD